MVVQFGLSKFLDKVLSKNSRIFKAKEGRPLLDYALSPPPRTEYDLIKLDIINVLLKHGTNPGQRYGKSTC